MSNAKSVKLFFLGFFIGIILSVIGFYIIKPFEPKNFEDCILHNMKEGMGDHAAQFVYIACSDKFSEKEK